MLTEVDVLDFNLQGEEFKAQNAMQVKLTYSKLKACACQYPASPTTFTQ